MRNNIQFFFPNPHWTGVFVEANHKNVADLKNMIISKGPAVINRTFVFDKAVSQKCDTPYVEFLRPLYEELQAETKKEVPHWYAALPNPPHTRTLVTYVPMY